MSHPGLLEQAKALVGKFSLSKASFTAGAVSSALITDSGNIYTGICLDLACGIGFCAEHAAIAEMLKSRETIIDTIVAMNAHKILPPCGRCRELIVQVNRENWNTKVVITATEHVLLKDLLPQHWL